MQERRVPQVYLLTGPSCTGKSYAVRTLAPRAFTAWSMRKHGAWVCDYKTDGEDVVLDGFSGEPPLEQLLQMLNGTPMNVRTLDKTECPFNPKRIFICSNSSPEMWYKDNKTTGWLNAIQQCFTEWYTVDDGTRRLDEAAADVAKNAVWMSHKMGTTLFNEMKAKSPLIRLQSDRMVAASDAKDPKTVNGR